ncbi:MAG: hypothetical protein ACT4QF_02760 [Sporichthyaceae bacterium]
MALVVLGLVVHLFGATDRHFHGSEPALGSPTVAAPMAPANDTVAPPGPDSVAAPSGSAAPDHAAVHGSDRDPNGVCGSLLRPGTNLTLALHSPTAAPANCVRSIEPPMRTSSAPRAPAIWLLDAPGVLRV